MLVFGAVRSADGFVAVVLLGANRSDEAFVDCGLEDVLSFFLPNIPLRRLLSLLACMVSVSLPSVGTRSVDGLRFCSLLTIPSDFPSHIQRYL